MNAIHGASPQGTGLAVPAREADPAAWHQSWRRALEQAQWEQSARARAPGPAPAVAPAWGDSPPSATAAAQHPASAQQAGDAAPAGAGNPQPVAARAATTGPPEAVLRPAMRAPRAEGALQATAPKPVPPAAPLAGLATAALAPPHRPAVGVHQPDRVAARRLLPAPLLPLLPEGAHASIDGSRVSVALRDASLDAAGAEALRARLQPMLRRQLRGLGLELAELRINGQAGPAEPPTKTRSTQWL